MDDIVKVQDTLSEHPCYVCYILCARRVYQVLKQPSCSEEAPRLARCRLAQNKKGPQSEDGGNVEMTDLERVVKTSQRGAEG